MTLKREIKDAYIEGRNPIYVKTHGDAVYVNENETETLTQRLDNVKDSIAEHTLQLEHDVHVSTFGAKGDGVTDDTEAINNAIKYASNNNKVLNFSPKVYRGKNIVILDNTIINGNGATIKTSDNADKVNNDKLLRGRFIGTGTTKTKNIVIKDLILDGNYDIVQGDDQFGVDLANFYNFENVLFENCTFKNNKYGALSISNITKCIVKHCNFIKVDCGVLTQGEYAIDVLVDGCYFDGHDWSEPISFYCPNNKKIHITNNTIKNKTIGNAIWIGNTEDCLCSDNLIDNCASGITCKNSVQVDIYSNKIKNSGYSITADTLKDCNIYNNTIENSKDSGLKIVKCNSVSIKGNTINGANLTKGTNVFTFDDNNFCSILDNKIIVKSGNLTVTWITLRNSNDNIIERNMVYSKNTEGILSDVNFSAMSVSIISSLRNKFKDNNTRVNDTFSTNGLISDNFADISSNSIYNINTENTDTLLAIVFNIYSVPNDRRGTFTKIKTINSIKQRTIYLSVVNENTGFILRQDNSIGNIILNGGDFNSLNNKNIILQWFNNKWVEVRRW